MKPLHKDILIVLLIGVLGAILFLVNYKLLGKTRWGPAR